MFSLLKFLSQRCLSRLLLAQDLQQFNDFFIEKEEECIIRTQALEEQLSKTDKSDVALLGRLRSAFVDLHGGTAAGQIGEIM